jgi:hypothetical protein
LVAQPAPYVPVPSEQDYEAGEITRYFAQQANQPDGEVLEISKQTFQALQRISLFRTVSLRWKVSGVLDDSFDAEGRLERPGVETANVAAINIASKTMPAIKRKLTNPLQLWRGY